MLAIVEPADVFCAGGRKCEGGDEDQGIVLSVCVDVGGCGILSLGTLLVGVLAAGGRGGRADGALKSRSKSSSSLKSLSLKKTADCALV